MPEASLPYFINVGEYCSRSPKSGSSSKTQLPPAVSSSNTIIRPIFLAKADHKQPDNRHAAGMVTLSISQKNRLRIFISSLSCDLPLPMKPFPEPQWQNTGLRIGITLYSHPLPNFGSQIIIVGMNIHHTW